MKIESLSGLIALLLLVFFLISCAGGPPTTTQPSEEQEAEPLPEEKVYEGAGQDESMLTAMNKAKMDAVRKAVIDLIGVANEQANREKLGEVLYDTSNPNAFVNNDTFETLRKDKVGEQYVF
ncbi:MAG: hypothetical protein JXB06_05695, partial [Spirochaetales bacterium]|nr:hypothetical protein [Spirochaetales bacterium]